MADDIATELHLMGEAISALPEPYRTAMIERYRDLCTALLGVISGLIQHAKTMSDAADDMSLAAQYIMFDAEAAGREAINRARNGAVDRFDDDTAEDGDEEVQE